MSCLKICGGMKDIPELKGIESFEIITLSDECSKSQKKEIREKLKNMKDNKVYSTLLQIKKEDDNVRIMVKIEKDVVKEVLLLVISDKDENLVLMSLKGKMKKSDLSGLVAKYDKNDGC
jgi:hypothetical protein